MARTCGSYWTDWTDECRRTGCKTCGTIEFDGLPPENCTCEAKTTIGGFVYETVLTRSETCSIHGRCRCGSGPSYYDDHREVDCFDREWDAKCPLIYHRKTP